MPNQIDSFSSATLLPVATRIDDQVNSAAAAVPLAQFDYDTALAREQQQLQENVAYSIPNKPKTAVADDSTSRVRFAECKGLVAAEEEIEAVRKMNRTVVSKDYHSKLAVATANRIAKKRNHESLQRTENNSSNYVDREGTRSPEINIEQVEPKMQNGGYPVGGYDVKEYEVGDYQTSDYEVHEYRSVYD